MLRSTGRSNAHEQYNMPGGACQGEPAIILAAAGSGRAGQESIDGVTPFMVTGVVLGIW